MKKIYQSLLIGLTVVIVGAVSILFLQRSVPIVYGGANNITKLFGIDINNSIDYFKWGIRK